MSEPTRPRAPHLVHALRRVLGAVAIVAVGVMVATGTVAFETPRARAAAPVSTVAESLYSGAVGDFKLRRLQAIGAIAVAESVVASAQLALDTSAGKVLSQAARTALLETIRAEEARVASAKREIERGNRITDPSFRPGSYFAARAGLHTETAALGAYRFAAASGLVVGRQNLAAPVTAVRDAVTAWQAEQVRIAAEKAAKAARIAAAKAAHLAAESTAGRLTKARSSSAAAPRLSSRPPAPAARFNKYVWTSGWQAQIDACRGAVDVTGRYGVAVIAEHWRCGGSSFPRAGTIITLSGVRSGTYRVGAVVAVLNAKTQGTASVPRGYGLLYQTCINGSNATMSFTVLTKVG
ncbi:MAG: hypothetical protein ABIX44_07010 [Cryobacterium sp.]